MMKGVDFIERISDRIRLLRTHLGLSQKEFAERINTGQGAITGYESGARAISDKTIRFISAVYGVNEEWLRTGDGDMFAQREPDYLAKVAEKYSLTPTEKIIVEAYVSLEPKYREGLMTYLDRVIDAISREKNADKPQILSSNTGQEADSHEGLIESLMIARSADGQSKLEKVWLPDLSKIPETDEDL